MAARNGCHKVSKSVKNGHKNARFWVVWVPMISMQGSISTGTNLDDQQTWLITV